MGFPHDRNGAFSALRIKFATGRTSASLCVNSCPLFPDPLFPVPDNCHEV
ncbi:hypothetical protein [Moorena producens]|nr:hypothetical protein [Moorena producens]